MLSTARLFLRPHRIEDEDAYTRLWAAEAGPDPRGVPTFTLSPEDAFARLLRFIGHRAMFGFAPLLAIDTASGELVGECGYGHFRRGFGPDYDDDPEAMWRVSPA